MAKKLKNIKLTKVALVDEGSCSVADITLYKFKTGGKDMPFEELMKSLPEDQRATITAEIEKAKAEVPAETATKLVSVEGDLTKAKEDLAAANTELAKAKAGSGEEDILKNADPAVVAMITKMREESAAAVLAIEKMKDATATQEALAKAKECKVPGETTDIAAVIKCVTKADAAMADKLVGILKAAGEAIEKGALFTEAGSSAENKNSTAWDEIEKQAKALVTSGVCKSQEAAVTEVLAKNRALYTAYMKEQNEN